MWKKEVEARAWVVYHLALNRVGLACPKWVKCNWRFKKRLIKPYIKAQTKNYFNRYGTRFHVDHIIPLKGKDVCGLHVPWNLHVIPAPVNMAKGTMIVEEYFDKDSVTTKQKHLDKVAATNQENDRRREIKLSKRRRRRFAAVSSE